MKDLLIGLVLLTMVILCSKVDGAVALIIGGACTGGFVMWIRRTDR